MAVLGVFFELADQSTFDAKWENKFIKYLANITNEGDEIVIPNKNEYKNILDLIRYDVKDFYSYKGNFNNNNIKILIYFCRFNNFYI